MSGYSGTPLPKKLGLRPGTRLLLLGAPRGFLAELGPLPEGARRTTAAARRVDLILAFFKTAAELERRFRPLAAKLEPAGMLWVAWPKKSSGVVTDLAFDVVQGVGLAAGLVDNKICAVNDVWSGLRFVIRVADRPRRSRH